MLDLELFRRLPFTTGITSGLLSYLVLFGVLLLVPFYLERGLRVGAGRAGIELMVMPLMLGLVAPYSGRLADRVGARPLTTGGMGLAAVAMVVLGVARPPTVGFLFLVGLVGVGLGLFTPPNNAAIMSSAPREQSGVASGVLNMTRGMGTALGLAITGLVFALAGGESSVASVVARAFTVTIIFLASVAVVAGLLSALRGSTGIGGGATDQLETCSTYWTHRGTDDSICTKPRECVPRSHETVPLVLSYSSVRISATSS